MRKAIINENGIVENIIEADESFVLVGKTLVDGKDADIGMSYNGISFVKPGPTPREILQKRKAALAAKWPDAFDLLDDILARGLAAVKSDRDAIKTANPKSE